MVCLDGDGVGNADLVIDCWHIFRGGVPLSELARIPPGRVLCVQVSDADADPVGREFLEYLTKPTPFLISGNFIFEDDVTVELLREKVSEISLSGNLEAPRHLVPLVQFLTTEKSGNISARD